jgi:hypothetical protein
MRRSKLLILPLAAAIAFGSPAAIAQGVQPPAPTFHQPFPWWVFACPGGVVSAAVIKNWKRNKELTSPEAWTCGLLYWWNEATGQYGR